MTKEFNIDNNIENHMIQLEKNIQQIQVEIAKINNRMHAAFPHIQTKNAMQKPESKLNTFADSLRSEVIKWRKTIIVWIVIAGIFQVLISWYGPSLFLLPFQCLYWFCK